MRTPLCSLGVISVFVLVTSAASSVAAASGPLTCSKILSQIFAAQTKFLHKQQEIDELLEKNHDYKKLCDIGTNQTLPEMNKAFEEINRHSDVCAANDPKVASDVNRWQQMVAVMKNAVEAECAKAR